MNLKAPLVTGCLTAVLLVPSISTFAGNRQGASYARSGGARSSPQRAAFRGGGGYRGSMGQFRASPGTFRGNGAVMRPSRSNWAGTNRFAGVPRTNAWTGNTFATNRATRGTNVTNWNRFNSGSTRFSNNWTTTNRFRASGINHYGHAGNWGWHHHHNNHSTVVFSFGFPFFTGWDYGYYYPSAYYPYYPYTPYYYNPYTYYPGYSGYNGYIDPGYGSEYNDNGQYYDPGYGNNGQPYDSHQYNRGTHDNSVVSQVQEQLAHDGYYKGTIDGVAGSRTYYAIRAYQRDHNLPVTGEITDDLLGEMGLR